MTGAPSIALLGGTDGERERLAEALALAGPLRLLEPPADPAAADVLVVCGPASRHAALAGEALRRGRTVVLAAPDDIDALAGLVSAGGPLHAPGRIGASEAGRLFLASLREGAAGRLLSLWLAVRGHRTGALVPLLWDAASFIDDVLAAPVLDLHATGGSLFGDAPDTAVVIARAAGGTVVTIDVSLCLPDGLPVAGPAEVEGEAMGTAATLRLLPFARAVRLATDGAGETVFFGEEPVAAMVADALAARAVGRCPMPRDALRRRLAVVRAVLASLESGEVVAPAVEAAP